MTAAVLTKQVPPQSLVGGPGQSDVTVSVTEAAKLCGVSDDTIAADFTLTSWRAPTRTGRPKPPRGAFPFPRLWRSDSVNPTSSTS